MLLSFIQPAWLWLLLLLLPLALLTIVAPRHIRRWRVWISVLLRSLIFGGLVLALAGTQVVRQAEHLTTVFVLDSSDSIAPPARARAERYIQTALTNMPDGDQAALVVFGTQPLVERAPSASKQLLRITVAPPSAYTDIERALQLALVLLPGETRKRVVLLSDGGENRGRATDVAVLARAAGVPLETVSLVGPPPANDVVLETLDAPANVRDRQPIRLTIHARATAPTTARLRVLLDRQPVLDTTVNLNAGLNQLPVTVPAPGTGFHAWEARLEAPKDGIGANNVGFGFSIVRGVPMIAVVEGAPGRGSNLVAALQAAQYEVVTLAPAALPLSLIGLDAYDAVVLVDVPYRSLPPTAVKLLPAYVRELGRGLMMVGGADSYAAGGYHNTPIEAALPVTMRTRGVKVRPDVALVLVIDHSGSMSGDKLDLAREGAAQAFAALNDTDQIGVIQFDNAADWVVPLQPRPTGDTFTAALQQIGVGGGTDLRPGLVKAADALEAAAAKIKHVVLLTDGQADRNYDDVVARLQAHGITLSTVGVGRDYDAHLKDIAPLTGGRFYEALDFKDIPALFFDETLRIARRGIVEHDFTPRQSFPSAVLRDITAVPPLHGYNAVTSKATAQTVLISDEDDPILAHWQYGLGRTVAWTSDLRGQWGRDWVGWSSFGRFAAQLIGSVLPTPTPPGFLAGTTVEGAALVMTLRADTAAGPPQTGLHPIGRLIAPDGRSAVVPLVETAPGRYRGTLGLPDAGVYQAQVVATDATGQLLGIAQTGAVVPPSAEYLQRDGNPGLLQALADATGGRVNLPVADVWQLPATAPRRASPITWWLMTLALLLWPLDIAVRRLVLPRPAPVQSWLARQRSAVQPSPAHQRARLSTPPPPSSPLVPAVQPPPPPPAATPPPVTPQFDWRTTRRTRVERPNDRAP